MIFCLNPVFLWRTLKGDFLILLLLQLVLTGFLLQRKPSLSNYHGLNASPQYSHIEALTLQCDGIWSWSLWEVTKARCSHEGGDLMMGSVFLLEETLLECTARTQLSATQGANWSSSWPSSLQHWENIFLLFKTTSLWYFVIASWDDTSTKDELPFLLNRLGKCLILFF